MSLEEQVREDDVTYPNRGTSLRGSLGDLKADQRDAALKGAQILGAALKAEGVDQLFGYPGGANLEIFDVLHQFGIRCIRTEHEQGAVHAAQGFARATGRVGVCLATSGPGATNLVTGIADANSDSTPVVAITGNVPSHLLGKNAFQEVDIVAITRPITKRNYLVSRVRDIPSIVREAFALASGQRPGPVLIDIPKDIQQQYPRDSDGNYVAPEIPAVIEIDEPVVTGIDTHQLDEVCRLIRQARRPIIYAGGGLFSADCTTQLIALAETLRIPVTNTIMAHGLMPPEHPLALQVLGMHGSCHANIAINEADLVLALGVRFDDRVTGDPKRFIVDGRIVHIDIDRNELNKNKTVTLPICADLRVALEQLLTAATAGETGDWLHYLDGLREQTPFVVPDRDALTPQFAIDQLSRRTDGRAIVSVGVGQHQMWAMQFYRSRQPHAFLSSSGFGTMGYGLPAAIGAKTGRPDAMVIDIDGDGSLNMTIHELATCHRYGIGVKVVVINNQWLGMVRQWQDMIYDRHRSASDLSDPGANANTESPIYPDFPTIARGYGVTGERVRRKHELSAAFDRMLDDPDRPYLLDVVVEREENVYPMIPAGGSYRDMIRSETDMTTGAGTRQGSNI